MNTSNSVVVGKYIAFQSLIDLKLSSLTWEDVMFLYRRRRDEEERERKERGKRAKGIEQNV